MSVAYSRAFSIIIVLFAIYSFANAGMDYSYDYSVYMHYTESTFRLDMSYLNNSVKSYFPFPYVLIPPYATFEYGYVVLTLLLGYMGMSAAAVYAVIGTTSIAIRAFILEKAKAGLLFNILITICYITLFEANALRVGVSSSICLISLYFLQKNRYILSIILALFSILFHVQSAIYIFTFLMGMGIYIGTINRPYLRVFFITAGIALTFIAIPAISLPFGTKVDDYLLRTSQATGLNIISGSSLIAIGAALVAVPSVTRIANGPYLTSWIASLFAFAQSTIFLIFGGAYADIGVRVWQFAFLFFAIASVSLNTQIGSSRPKTKAFDRSIKLVMFCALLQAINVIIRYPLSNFFYPFSPYVDIHYVRF